MDGAHLVVASGEPPVVHCTACAFEVAVPMWNHPMRRTFEYHNYPLGFWGSYNFVP